MADTSGSFRTPRPGLSGSIVFGIVLASLVVGLGSSAILTRPTVWESQTTLLVLPRGSGSDATMFELLNQGQVVTTYSAVLRSNIFTRDVARAANVTARPVALEAAQLPDTFLIRLTALAPTAVDSARLAQAAARRAPEYIADLDQPFAVRPLDASSVVATRRSVATPGLAVSLLIIAVIVGLAGQQAYLQLRRARHARRYAHSRARRSESRAAQLSRARQERRLRQERRVRQERRARGRSA